MVDMARYIYIHPDHVTSGVASSAFGLDAHWTAATLAAKFAKLRAAADEG